MKLLFAVVISHVAFFQKQTEEKGDENTGTS